MSVFTLILYMYAIAAVISFLVAFLISALIHVIKFSERKKHSDDKFILSTAKSMTEVQSEARLMGNDKEVAAAIAMALHLYSKEIHDDEALKLTIKRSAKTYSPWNSKIYGLNTYKR